MKAKLLLLITVVSCGYIYAQDLKIGHNHYLIVDAKDLPAQTITTDKVEDKSKIEELYSETSIKIINLDAANVTFRFLFPSESTDLKYIMDKESFKKFTKPYFNRFRGFKYGTYTVPIRLRNSKDNFEFDANLSLGANAIASFGSRLNEHRYIDFSVGVSLTKVNLNSENSLLGTEGTDYENIEVLSPTAFTFSLGAIVNLDKNINLGLHYGWDFLSSADNKASWIYNKKPWLGVGLNIVFSNENIKNDSGE